ncbi:hypothetical protein [Amycolatopsis sp. NPDC058986]|uniref:hypothetical protein n=1 Tax=unclassified Amycolatopsis TaxID=2618356 RepID=UPI00366CDC61
MPTIVPQAHLDQHEIRALSAVLDKAVFDALLKALREQMQKNQVALAAAVKTGALAPSAAKKVVDELTTRLELLKAFSNPQAAELIVAHECALEVVAEVQSALDA